MNQIKVLNELAAMSEAQEGIAYTEHDSEQKLKKMKQIANMEKKTTDKVIELADMELERSGVTLYGHNGPINLTPLEHKFSIGYVKSGSVVEAMKFAGHKGKKTEAQTLGYQLFNNPKVAEAIAVIEKQHVLASGLTELEVIAGIRDVTMLARQKGAFTAALKGYAMLGDYLNMWEESKAAKKKQSSGQGSLTLNGDIFINNSGGGGDKQDMVNDVRAFGEILGFSSAVKVKPQIIKDITAETILAEEPLPSSKREIDRERNGTTKDEEITAEYNDSH